MPFEFEALVGNLYVVGGRAISTAPPGALVEVAPKKAARGREADTFFALVLPSGDAIAPTAFYEQMAQLAAERYFNTTGSVTSGLRDVFHTLNENLLEHNQSGKRPYEANLICAVLRGHDLFAGRVGSGVIIIQNEGLTSTFPEDLSNDEMLYIPPLGVHPIPNVKMTQYRVRSGTRIAFGDSNLAELDRSQMSNAMMSVDLGAVLVGFKDLARLQMSLMLAEFIPPDMPMPVPFPEGQSTAEIAAKARTDTAKARRTDEVPASNPVEARKQTRREKSSENAVQNRAKRGIGMFALGLSRILGLMNLVLERLLGPAEEGERRWLMSPVGTGMVVLVPVIVATLVLGLSLFRTGESAYEICVQEVESRAQLARNIVNSERQTVINAWELTLAKVEECNALRPGDPNMAALRREGQSHLDGLNQTQRHDITLVETLEGAVLTRIILHPPNIYVLDAANGFVYHVTLNESGLQRASPSRVLVRRGGTINNIPIGEIVDIAYNSDDNRLVVLDQNGVLIQCSTTWLQCEAQRLQGVERWNNPVAFTVWSQRLYILDTGAGDAGQVWRYDRTGGVYSNSAPVEYFPASSQHNVHNGVDIKIDGGGNLYVLLADGDLSKFRGGQPQDFAFVTFPDGQELQSATSMFLDDRPTSQTLYVADRSRRAVYQTSLIGGWFGSHRIFEEENFNLLSGVAVVPGSSGRDRVYTVSGNAIFVFEK